MANDPPLRGIVTDERRGHDLLSSFVIRHSSSAKPR